MSLKIINPDFSDNNDVIQEFLCDGLPPSFNMCNLRGRIKTEIEKNKSPDIFWCDMVATEAHSMGLMMSNTDKLSRTKVAEKIEQFQEDQGLSCSNFPKSCPTIDFYDRLFKKSMELHYKVFPDDYKNSTSKSTIESFYRQKFEKAKSKFCTLNFTSVFKDNKLRKFLGRL